MQDKAGAELGALLEQAPRVHDIELKVEAVASANAGKVPGAGALLLRRVLLGCFHQPSGSAGGSTARSSRGSAVALARRLLGWGGDHSSATGVVEQGVHGSRAAERHASGAVGSRQGRQLAGGPG